MVVKRDKIERIIVSAPFEWRLATFLFLALPKGEGRRKHVKYSGPRFIDFFPYY